MTGLSHRPVDRLKNFYTLMVRVQLERKRLEGVKVSLCIGLRCLQFILASGMGAVNH